MDVLQGPFELHTTLPCALSPTSQSTAGETPVSALKRSHKILKYFKKKTGTEVLIVAQHKQV